MIIKVCNWKNCQSKFNSYIISRIKNDILKFNLEHIEIEEHPCMWFCEEWPIVKIDKEILKNANPIKASEMIFKRINGNKKNNSKKKRKDKEKSEVYDEAFDENYIK